MLILFDLNGKRVTDFGTNSAYPNGIPYEPKEGDFIYRIHDDDPKVNEILNAGSIEGNIVESEVVDVTIYKRIIAVIDKLEIVANGTDTATITATVDDTTSTETIELYHGYTIVDSKPAVNGVATFEVTMTETGELTLTVKSTTKYGQSDVTITGV